MSTFATLLMLSACGCWPCANQSKPNDGAKSKKPYVIVALGDSTTAARPGVEVFSSLLQKRLAKLHAGVEIINAGVPGDTSVRARARFKDDVLGVEPSLVLIFLGINDSAVDVYAGATEPRVSLADYEANLTWMVSQLQSQRIRTLLLTPTPVAWTDELKALYNKPPYRTEEDDGWNTVLKDYAAAVQRVAKSKQVPLIDIYQAFHRYGAQPGHTLNELMTDGMHPNSLGHAMITDEVEAQLLPLLNSDRAEHRNSPCATLSN